MDERIKELIRHAICRRLNLDKDAIEAEAEIAMGHIKAWASNDGDIKGKAKGAAAYLGTEAACFAFVESLSNRAARNLLVRELLSDFYAEYLEGEAPTVEEILKIKKA